MADFDVLRREMDRLFDETVGWRWGREERVMRLPVDAYVTDDELVITLAIPGVAPDDVEVTFEGDVLTIKGELPAPLGNVDYLLQERSYGSFLRTVTVNTPVQADKIAAQFDRGLLTVTLPRVEEAKPKTIAIKVKK
jgi:HSP20 family protein